MPAPLTADFRNAAVEIVLLTGEAVTFTAHYAGTHNPLNETTTGPSTVTMTGRATEVANKGGEKIAYEGGEMVVENYTTLVFVPDASGDIPPQDSTVQWAGRKRKVLATDPIRPDGTAIASKVYLV